MAHERPSPLARAREIADELAVLVIRARERVAELEAERDQLRRELACALGGRRAPDRAPPSPREPARVRGGGMRDALSPALAGSGRRSASLVALLGGRSGAGV